MARNVLQKTLNDGVNPEAIRAYAGMLRRCAQQVRWDFSDDRTERENEVALRLTAAATELDAVTAQAQEAYRAFETLSYDWQYGRGEYQEVK